MRQKCFYFFILIFLKVNIFASDNVCTKDSSPDAESSCPRKCLEFDPKGPSVCVKDSTGRLGNHMFTYTTLAAIKIRYNIPIYLAKRSHDLLSKFFRNLTIPVADEHLCGFGELYETFRQKIKNQKTDNIVKIMESRIGHKLELSRDENGRVIIPRGLLNQYPNLIVDDIVHTTEFDEVENMDIPQTSSYPWKIYNDSVQGLEKMLTGKAILLYPPSPTDLDFVNETPGLEEALDEAFVFRDEFISLARSTLDKVLEEHKKKRKKKKKKSKQRENDYVFVGIHSRRGDHLSFDSVKGNKILKASYFLEAMDMYREFYKNVIFLYISDDLEWGKTSLGQRRRASEDLYFVGEGIATSDLSIGHDLALMSLCNHTIISHGTFSFWSGFLAGGKVITPYHFPELRPKDKVIRGYVLGPPLKNPLPRLHYQ